MSNKPNEDRCLATTRAGNPCKNWAQAGSQYCHVHRSADSQMEVAGLPEEQVELVVEGATAVEAGTPLEEAAPAAEIPVEEELTEQELRQRLMAELDSLIARVQALVPDYTPPPYSPQRMLNMLSENGGKMSPRFRLGILKRLRGAVNEDLLDAETWKGMWYMLNYTLEYQGDILKRRLTGDYDTDEWGLDWEFLEAVRPFLDFMYKLYWRVESSGIEHIPDYERAVLAANHSGQLPWDAAMMMTAVLSEHPAQRLVRNLYEDWFPTIPFFSTIFVKMGQALASVDNGVRLLEQEELIGVFPEGIKGPSKSFNKRYQLARFGHNSFVKMALQTQAPIIPVSIVGAEESYITLAQSGLLARLTGLPYFPITPTFPWLGILGLIPLPTKWYIDFGEPIPTEEYGPESANDLVLVSKLTDRVRDAIQTLVNERLLQRGSVFL